jgi:phage major head subunit gpT-like protein
MDDIFIRGLQSAYQENYDAYQPLYSAVTMETTSDGPDETYAWLGSLPRMREFRGERIPKRLLDYRYKIVNKEFESSLEIAQKDIDDDQTGKYGPLARSMGDMVPSFKDELIFGTLLPGGFSSLAYDGQFFFDSDHVDGASGVQSNLITTKFGPTGFLAARSLMRRLKDDNGRPINPNMNLVVEIPPESEAAAEALFLSEFTSPGVRNPYYRAATYVVNPWLTDVNAWYLINTVGVVKPFVLQERTYEPLSVLEGKTASQGNDSEQHFMRRVNYMGIYWRGNAGYGLWQKAIGSTGATGTLGA